MNVYHVIVTTAGPGLGSRERHELMVLAKSATGACLVAQAHAARKTRSDSAAVTSLDLRASDVQAGNTPRVLETIDSRRIGS